MPTISKIRFTNVVYEGGNKRYADEIFHFHGENSAIVLENGGGKTVFIQTALQAILPHTALANRKVKDTFSFDDGPAHIAIEWIKNDRPRMYALTVITIFPHQNAIDSYRYVYEYGPNDANSIEHLPFTHETAKHQKRIASHAEMKEYYTTMSQKNQLANTFSTITGFTEYIEKNFQIIADEWRSISTINAAEGDVEKFFEACPTEKALYEKLLIPTVEQSIAAFEKHQFVDIFEKHRDKFKLLKQLNAQLKEYDLIQQQLAAYVNDVHVLHEFQEQYDVEKQRMKAYFELLSAAIQKNIEQLKAADEQQLQLDEHGQQLEVKQKSYAIALMEEALLALTASYETLQQEVTALQTKLEQQERHFGNIKYAKEKNLLKQAQQQQQLFEHELKQMDAQYSTEQLLDQLDEVKAKLRGDWLTVEQQYEQQRKGLQRETRQKKDMLEQQQRLLENIREQRQQLQKAITEIQANIKFNTKQSDAEAKEIFENDVQRQQPTLELRTLWTEESQAIDERVVTLKNEKKQLELTKQQHEQRLEALRSELLQLNTEETKMAEKIEAIEAVEQKLVAQLSTVLPRVSEKTSLYLKEATLLHDLSQAFEKKRQLYAEKLYEERLALRHVDDYGQQQTFFADPYIAKKIPVWSQRFSYLETAIDYALGDDQLQFDTALLAITLITTEEEKPKLEQLVLDAAKYLTYPIQIWTLPQVVAIGQGKPEPTTELLQPALWQELGHAEAFKQWQQQAANIAGNIKKERENADEQRSNLKALLSQLQDFYAQYPQAHFQRLQEQLKTVQSKTYEVKHEKGALTKSVAGTDEQVRNLANKISTQSQLKKYYDDKIDKLLKYDKLLKELHQLQRQLVLEQQKLDAENKQFTQAGKEQETLVNDLAALKDRTHGVERDYNVLIATRHLYKQVEGYTPKFTDESYDVLAQQYGQIDNQINGIISSRQQLEKQIAQQQKYIQQHEKEMKHIETEYDALDEQFVLPLDYERQLEQLPAANKRLREDRMIVAKKREQAKEQKDKHEGALLKKREELDQCIQFDVPLPTVQYQLEEEAKRLQLQQNQLSKTKSSLLKEKEQAEKLAQKLQILNAENGFLTELITPMSLTAEEENDFGYRQQHFIERTTKQLASCKKSIERQQKIVADSKGRFIQHCQQNVSEVRLRNTIIDGVKVKHQYNDLLKHQQEMEKTIHISRQYAEKDIKKHDEDLVQFVQRVHIHLRKVVDELKHIPRKTKVSVDGEDMPIYRFTIPEWTDEEGLAQIRTRVEWIIEQLEQLESRTVDEQEGKQKSRKQLEEWLSTVQLLRYITQHKEWRVACRKVMNDNRISSKYETWSRSNAWSGGEKWSKNMALFLGVLNYVAEKRQLIASKQKSRTVILDNPFGKASSDHVLSPVFFIAKQLGFQIIALTAHVEGKFLHDYFPVVYSCRLRSAVGTDKLVMETKKTMHQAFFRDHNEDAEETVQIEQLKLF
ncbi:hypothetical protein ACTHOQ_17130 [Solibacillus silvestris]|uniref:hypothetical protein n=1 Tax=Solibacillus silvestris TaxID=76853 RepID=UPI003F7FDA0E